MLQIEMISTGNELLTGDILDTNSAWLGEFLTTNSITLNRRQTIGDNKEDLISAFKECNNRADWVIVNGGLGPTTDDLSSEAIAEFLNVKLILNQTWLDHLEKFFQQRNWTMADNNKKQAMLPEGAKIFENSIGTACAFMVQKNNTKYLFTAGVPREFKHTIKNDWFPILKQELQQNNLFKPLKIKKFIIFGLGESTVNDKLETISLPKNYSFGYRATTSFIELKLVYPENNNALNQIIKEIYQILNENILAENQTLVEYIQKLMITKQLTLSVAESCTGGLISSEITKISGSSQYFNAGFTTYSNQAKNEILNVKQETLDKFGAVSLEVVEAMAKASLIKGNSAIALATSGIAGPTGGSIEKPIGTVCFALATKDICITKKLNLGKHRTRENIQEVAKIIALDMLKRYLLNQDPKINYDIFK